MEFLALQQFFGLALAGVVTIFWFWMIVDCAMKEPVAGNSKVVWLLIIVFGNIPGAGIYYCIRRPRRLREEAEEDEASERLRRNPRPV